MKPLRFDFPWRRRRRRGGKRRHRRRKKRTATVVGIFAAADDPRSSRVKQNYPSAHRVVFRINPRM